jgi:predicted dehydrogenase
LERANKLVSKEHSYKEPDDMYKNENIDAVYIATPHHLHESMIKQALEQGKHVFCEKPVSSSIESAREIFKITKKYSSLKLGFNYQCRYDYNCYNLAEGVKKGHLGKIYYANCNVYFSRNLDYFNQGPWRTKINTAGGGTLLIHGSHILDVIIWALGEPISVIGKIDNLKFKDIEVEDIGFGIIQFENGSYTQINDSMIIKPKKKKLDDIVELTIFGENGSCYYEGPWPFSSLKWYGVENFKLKENPPGVSDYSECLKAYARWILYNEPFYNIIEESSKVLLLIKALYKSSESGKKERIEKL